MTEIFQILLVREHNLSNVQIWPPEVAQGCGCSIFRTCASALVLSVPAARSKSRAAPDSDGTGQTTRQQCTARPLRISQYPAADTTFYDFKIRCNNTKLTIFIMFVFFLAEHYQKSNSFLITCRKARTLCKNGNVLHK